MNQKQYERVVRQVLEGKDDATIELEPIEDLRAKHCRMHAEVILALERQCATLKKLLETRDRTIAELRAAVGAK